MTITDAVPPIQRDRFGRPLVIPPEGGKPEPYTRATTLAETLDDRYNLELWKLRQVAIGLAARPDLLALVGAQRDDKAALNRICADALDASQSGAAANKGTALHAFTEQLDRGQEPFGVPASMVPDLAAYREATAPYSVLGIETFVVCDELKVAGTFDRIFGHKDHPDRLPLIADLKSGAGAFSYGQPTIAVQLAVYSHSERYNPATGERSPLNVDQSTALVIHLPAETGAVELYEVDIAAGWVAAKEAVWVREWRKQRGLFSKVDAADPGLALLASVAATDTVADLYALWRRVTADTPDKADTEPLIALFAARKAQILSAAT